MEPEDEAFEELSLKQGQWEHTSGWRKKQIQEPSMTDKEAMVKALRALEGVLNDSPKVLDASISGGLYEVVQCRDAITALKARLAQPHETTLKEFNQLIHDDPKYHTWAKEKALQALHNENERLGLYKDAYGQPEQERNFCPRCGKRTKDLTHIHTCTPPPQEKT
jgi:hypothetical protein